ncbi:hypothetical protein MPH48_16540 [Lysinibacillus fusiformis]|uniref:hypothetical protein n=1 Tax=Lysinibacillus fusiformis TaxID=28031 RepID=UPI001F4E2362|nr:hypothetical protein [Lysinibacillus fusiformis]MCK1989700.1 hypothetical protein [Lysinibacillus fusiformis]
MRKKLGCLHAHHSNIEYIEQVFQKNKEIEVVHFVDPGLIHQVSKGVTELTFKIVEQIQWMASCDLDAILITCTNYIVLLEDCDVRALSIPIIKMDELYFELICNERQPQIILFTNPATVEGTMTRLHQYANKQGKSIDVTVKVIEHTFDLIMQGKNKAYNAAIIHTLHHEANEQRLLSVAQLSMVSAAQQFEESTAIPIMHPLKALGTVVEKL